VARRRTRRPPWQRRRRRTLILVGVPLACFAVFFVWRARLRRDVESRLDAIRAAGLPATAAELNEWYGAVPPEENAATVYIEAFDAIAVLTAKVADQLPLWGTRTYEPDEAYPEDVRAAITAFLADNARTLGLLHQGAALPRSRYPMDLSAGYGGVRFEHHGKLGIAAKILAVEAALAAEMGDPDQAADSMLALLALTRSLATEPAMRSHWNRMQIQRLAYGFLERLLHRVQFTDPQLARLADALLEADDPEAFYQTLVGERCFALSAMDYTTWPTRGGQTVVLFALDVAGIIDLALVTYLDMAAEVMAVASAPMAELVACEARLEARIEESGWIPRRFLYMFQPVSGMRRSLAFGDASLRCARTALAVERYRLARNALPDALDALVPDFIEAVPEDPFDDQPLRYRLAQPGYVVYSVSHDGADDGGIEAGVNTLARNRPQRDVTFTVKR